MVAGTGPIPAQRVSSSEGRIVDAHHEENTHVLPLHVRRARSAIDDALDDAGAIAPCVYQGINMERLHKEPIAEAAERLAPAARTCRGCPALMACRNWAEADTEATGIIGGMYYNRGDRGGTESLNRAIRKVLRNEDSERIG